MASTADTSPADEFLTASSFPQDILNSILSHLDLHTLVNFSSCAPRCQTIVFQEMNPRQWEEIRICGHLALCSINDEQLATFLRKINARDNTRALSLVGCPNLNGSGLEPLRGSAVLEDIDLRVRGSLPLKGEMGEQYGDTGLDTAVVTDILRPSLRSENPSEPLTLQRVAFRQQPTIHAARFMPQQNNRVFLADC